MTIEGPILLYGAGREALSTRQFLAEMAPDAAVHVVVDDGTSDIPDSIQVPVDTLMERIKDSNYAMIVRSAGVSMYKPTLVAARAAGADVTTNVNLWARHRRDANGIRTKVIAVTGTKGKSTTTKLIHTMLVQAGLDAQLAGNIGVPVLDIPASEYLVLELSSFQCADLELNPDFIGITSLFPEHLDWHNGPANYFKDKLNILRRKAPYKCALSKQAAAQPFIPQPNDEVTSALPKLEMSVRANLKSAVCKSKLRGFHNLENADLAARIAFGVGLQEANILKGIAVFEPLPHRLQERAYGGKTFVNDSIATNPEATKAAVASFHKGKVALIVGGYDRDQNFDDLIRFLQSSNLESIWFLPVTGHRIALGIDPKIAAFDMHMSSSLAEVFEQLAANPEQFDTLILSPGAPSFNQFKNFEERGETFLNLAQTHFGN